MFADYVKMGAKAVALGIGFAAILGFFSGFTIPGVNIGFVTDYMNKAYTIGVHYIPFFSTLWTLGVSLLTLEVTLFGVRLALIATRWILKVNE